MLTADALILTSDELAALTGYQRPAEQLAELRRQGFARARRDRTGRVILPDPLVMVNRYGIGASTADGDGCLFTADQMRAYAAAAVERRASLASDFAEYLYRVASQVPFAAARRRVAGEAQGEMMYDLVQRLRYMAEDEAPSDMVASETARQAADEIERLRAQLAERDRDAERWRYVR